MSQESVRWEDFDKMHVIRKLKEIVGKWWRVQINFTDKKGLKNYLHLVSCKAFCYLQIKTKIQFSRKIK